jgi:uncharacterized membrane protein
MITKAQASDHVALGSIVLSVLSSAALYGSLPARVPTHFDIQGNANGWMSKPVGAFVLPAIALAVWVLLRLGPRILPASWRARLLASPTALVAAMLAVMFAALHVVVLYAATHPGRSVGVVLGVVLGASWIGLGLVLPRVRRNPWVGVRTAWTLSSDENWARTHRFAGYAFVIAGVVAAAGAWMLSPVVAPVAIVASALAATLYSFVVAHRVS